MDYEVRQLSSRVVSALIVVVCDMELNAVKVAESSGTKRSPTAKGSLYTWSHICKMSATWRGRLGMPGKAVAGLA